MVDMFDLVSFKKELQLLVNNLVKAVMSEMITAAEKNSRLNQNPGTDEKLGRLVDSLCDEAVDKILKVFDFVLLRQEKSPENLKDPHAAAEGLLKTEGGDGGDEYPPGGQTVILVFTSPAVSSKSVLLSVETEAHGENETDAACKSSSLHSKHSSPTPQADVPDHEYAQPPMPPPVVASAAVSSSHKKVANKPQSTETSEILSQCQQCGMLFPNKERLSDHQRKSHPVCSTCGLCFTGIQRLHEHEIQEHGLLPYGCEYCQKRFKHKPHLNLHVRARHTREKTCHCDICGKGYSCSSMLKTHRTTHFEKKFTCEVCGRSFHHACHLTRHKLVHQGVRPHRCNVCGKGFIQAGNLRSHQITHTGERQLCSICGKRYRRLKDHIISKHLHEPATDELAGREASVTCDVCGKKFSYLSHLMRHRSIHTGETPYSCSDCGKHFRLLTYLKAHLQTKAHLKQTQRRQSNTSDL
ncbi:zinc finger protein 708-like isoform X1 [Xyrichtys novacula]|uniref:Zinc finger protein 708-like isoform X1 n=1 Tax=Xyrichtys novacula TaxID=13765 RepID=A0AAV1FA54_XYRNO|nr:zinc finger protein 708-like isoform X1 [Xyrichtys novacula]